MENHWHKNREGVRRRKRLDGMQDPRLIADPDKIPDAPPPTSSPYLGEQALSETVAPPETWTTVHYDELQEEQWGTDGGSAWPSPEEA
jgi:hypothetical protein